MDVQLGSGMQPVMDCMDFHDVTQERAASMECISQPRTCKVEKKKKSQSGLSGTVAQLDMDLLPCGNAKQNQKLALCCTHMHPPFLQIYTSSDITE